MPIITVQNARDLARDWSMQNADVIPGFIGTYLTGSTAWGHPDDLHAEASDIDLIIVVDLEKAPDNIGKFRFRDRMLEIGFTTLAEISDMDTVLTDYHIAGAFRGVTANFDPTNQITAIQKSSALHFSKREFVVRRLEHAKQNALNFAENYGRVETLHDQVTSLFFAAGVTCHMLLVAALDNPTIRRRYIASREMLNRFDRLDLHEHMLRTLGTRELDTSTVQHHLDRLGAQFDIAGSILKTPYQFASDLQPEARAIAIGGTQEMIDQGFHREAMFWLIAVSCRCRAVIAVDGRSEMLGQFDLGFWEMLNSVGIRSKSDMDKRVVGVLQDIDLVWDASISIIENA